MRIMPTFSIEIFPPNTPQGLANLASKFKQLQQLKPQFTSVTFGALEASQCKTQHIVEQLIANKIAAVPHISCINMTKQRATELLNKYLELNVKQLVVVRGDCSEQNFDKSNQDFTFAYELIRFIRETTGDNFHITVAAYPEFHPQAINAEADLQNFLGKIQAGADSAITQYFFNTDAYFHFVECCEKLNINLPITPGILPITDYHKLMRFSTACGAEVPLWLRKRLEPYADNIPYLQALGVELGTKLCENLLKNKVDKLHFYSINNVESTALILKNLNLVAG